MMHICSKYNSGNCTHFRINELKFYMITHQLYKHHMNSVSSIINENACTQVKSTLRSADKPSFCGICIA